MVADATYEPRPIKRSRRSKSEMNSFRNCLYELAARYSPLTVRQLFYRAVAAGVVDKTQNAYKGIVRTMTALRKEGVVPFEWIVDNTRWMRKPDTHSSLAAMLEYSQQTYRRALWDNQDCYVEVWCESDSAAGILISTTAKYDVPLMSCRGQPSTTFLWTASQKFIASGKPNFIYYFGDYDKSGQDISDRIDRDLKSFLPPSVEFEFSRVAINKEQIEEFSLPTRPAKDKRSSIQETVELEAMTTEQIAEICTNSIEAHIDPWALQQQKEVEAQERQTLSMFMSQLDELN